MSKILKNVSLRWSYIHTEYHYSLDVFYFRQEHFFYISTTATIKIYERGLAEKFPTLVRKTNIFCKIRLKLVIHNVAPYYFLTFLIERGSKHTSVSTMTSSFDLNVFSEGNDFEWEVRST